ncbi:MAG: hypothetical protein MI924_34475 [Chloroflexales bacterium]|nr:hypothetical protein [Chloroflexales bacterium]
MLNLSATPCHLLAAHKPHVDPSGPRTDGRAAVHVCSAPRGVTRMGAAWGDLRWTITTPPGRERSSSGQQGHAMRPCCVAGAQAALGEEHGSTWPKRDRALIDQPPSGPLASARSSPAAARHRSAPQLADRQHPRPPVGMLGGFGVFGGVVTLLFQTVLPHTIGGCAPLRAQVGVAPVGHLRVFRLEGARLLLGPGQPGVLCDGGCIHTALDGDPVRDQPRRPAWSSSRHAVHQL